MIIGVTATQNGLTQAQAETAHRLLGSGDELHHGDCIGGDADLHAIFRVEAPSAKVVGHPPSDDSKRAFCSCDELREPKPYRERNTDIVEDVDVLIAFSGSMFEILRSGTWMTVRIARKKLARGSKIKIIIVWPDGTTSPGHDPKLTSEAARLRR